MNCQDIKNKLAEKDKEVAERNAKTIEYFNLVKDDAVSILIDDHIQGEFSSDFYYLSEGSVMKVLYKRLGVNTILMSWDSSLFIRSDWFMNMYKPRHLIYGSYCGAGCNEDELKKMNDIEAISEYIKSSFDYQMFGKLIEQYLVSKGFKQKVSTSRHGKKIKSCAFKISRNQIENGCCEKNGFIEFEDIKDNIKLEPFNVFIGVVFVIIVAIILYVNF
jgi:hypothetical protein